MNKLEPLINYNPEVDRQAEELAQAKKNIQSLLWLSAFVVVVGVYAIWFLVGFATQ